MAADVSFEATTVVLVWCSHLLLTPFVLSRDTRIALPALALLAGAGAALMATREVNLMLYTHYVPGTSALVVSRGVLRGDGSGPIVTASVIGPAIIFVIEVQTCCGVLFLARATLSHSAVLRRPLAPRDRTGLYLPVHGLQSLQQQVLLNQPQPAPRGRRVVDGEPPC